EERARERGQAATAADLVKPTVHMTAEDGSRRPLEETRLAAIIEEACNGLDAVSPGSILSETRRNLYDGITQVELSLAPIMAARTLIEQEPNYAFVAARLLLDRLRREALTLLSGRSEQATQAEMSDHYASYFPEYMRTGVEAGQIDPELSRFDLKRIAAALKPERDLNFQYLGLQTLYDRYLLHTRGHRFELPQAFFMRVAMGLAIREIDREARAVKLRLRLLKLLRPSRK